MPFPGNTTFPSTTTFPGLGSGVIGLNLSQIKPPQEWIIYIRDNRTLLRIAHIDDYQSAEVVCRFNAVGTWSIQVHRDVFHGLAIEPWNIGIEVVRRTTMDGAGVTILSGPLSSVHRERDMNSNKVTLTGADDMVWLANRLASPEPVTVAPPYSTSSHDIQTGVASTIMRAYVNNNAGPGAIGARRVPGLTVADDPFLGAIVNGRARWPILLELLQGLAISGGDLGFRIQQFENTIPFTIYRPTDKSSTIHFSVELGNLAGYTYDLTRPEASYVFVAGGDELTNRVLREAYDGPAQSTWGRIEQFRDRRDTLDVAELNQSATEHLAENGQKTSLSITPIDLPGQTFGVHYQLGDKVSVVIDGSIISDVVREVTIALTPAGPQTITPTIGTTGNQHPVRLFRSFRDVQRRLSNLERR